MNFHPVGQGLYASGHLYEELHMPTQPFFSWVYDCGTLSSNALVNNASKLLKTALGGAAKPRLGLVVISHFDKDHISGLVNLLLNFHVEVLLMPYLVPWQRAAIVFGNGVYVSKRDRAFILDPVGAIAAMQGVQVDHIVWAVAGDQNASPDGDDNFVNRNEPPVLTIDEGAPEDDWQSWEVNRGSLQGIAKVSMLRPGGRLCIRGIWEFVPYQDATIKKKPDASFLADASAKLEWLLKAPCEAFKDDVLKRLKALYEARFVGSKQRNIISMFMYAGSLGAARMARCGCTIPMAANYAPICVFHHFDMVNVIYTGDGYLDTPKRLSSLFKHLGARRMQHVLVFQVMHHGAHANWHSGLAHSIRPGVSVFSSDPTRGDRPHPHKPVELDFAAYSPRQVDRFKGLSLAGCFSVN
ncbi:hypothetical protein [Janthinobacterium sp. 64]|uniref:hypothetical protein n=1 Tax=Janthinobacterium sp. 64 TaxID=2035208 RepID=UPI0012FD0EA2|nr:hypothetical protein [Janthinobacterium sp. 64]